MKSILFQLDLAFRAAIAKAFNVNADPLINPSQNDKFGDYQSNAAMGLAKTLSEKTNPRAVAEKIIANLDLGSMAAEAPSIAGPGFINVRLSPLWLAEQLQQRVSDERLGIEPAAEVQTVVVDYSGPNIAKQMHVGHLRSTIIGDATSRIIEFLGHKVIRQNHIGDWGTQFGMLIAYLESKGPSEAINIADLEQFYKEAKVRFDSDDTFKDLARQRVVALQSGDPAALAAWNRIVQQTRAEYQPIYHRLNVLLTEADERGESFYNPFLADVVKDLKAAGLAVDSEGAVAVFADGHDKTPLIIQKSGGGFLYGTTDLAAIRYRVTKLGADRIIYTHDSRQAQHFSQVFRTADLAGWTRGGKVKLEYAPFGTMLGEDGKPFKTRSGDTIKLKDLLDEAEERAMKVVTEKNPELPEAQRLAIAHSIGIGGVKYSDLSKDRVSDYVFSWDKMLSLDGNTAPYLQYVYARIRSIFRKVESTEAPAAHSRILLVAPQEIALAKLLLRFSDVVEAVVRDLKPHQLCLYLYELATGFSGFYENCPVLKSEGDTRASRLALCTLTANTMKKGLDLLGIEHPEQM